METPLHHHPNDGGYYPDCKRCQMNAAAPVLAEACQAVMEWARTPGNHGGNPHCKDFVRKAEAALAAARIGI